MGQIEAENPTNTTEVTPTSDILQPLEQARNMPVSVEDNLRELFIVLILSGALTLGSGSVLANTSESGKPNYNPDGAKALIFPNGNQSRTTGLDGKVVLTNPPIGGGSGSGGAGGGRGKGDSDTRDYFPKSAKTLDAPTVDYVDVNNTPSLRGTIRNLRQWYERTTNAIGDFFGKFRGAGEGYTAALIQKPKTLENRANEAAPAQPTSTPTPNPPEAGSFTGAGNNQNPTETPEATSTPNIGGNVVDIQETVMARADDTDEANGVIQQVTNREQLGTIEVIDNPAGAPDALGFVERSVANAINNAPPLAEVIYCPIDLRNSGKSGSTAETIEMFFPHNKGLSLNDVDVLICIMEDIVYDANDRIIEFTFRWAANDTDLSNQNSEFAANGIGNNLRMVREDSINHETIDFFVPINVVNAKRTALGGVISRLSQGMKTAFFRRWGSNDRLENVVYEDPNSIKETPLPNREELVSGTPRQIQKQFTIAVRKDR